MKREFGDLWTMQTRIVHVLTLSHLRALHLALRETVLKVGKYQVLSQSAHHGHIMRRK